MCSTEHELTAGPVLPSGPGLPGLPVIPYRERSEVRGGPLQRINDVAENKVKKDSGESHLSSRQTRLTSAARLASGTFGSNSTRGTALTSGTL